MLQIQVKILYLVYLNLSGLTAGVIDQQVMLNPSRHLIPPPVDLGVRVSPFISLICNSYLYFETDQSLVS